MYVCYVCVCVCACVCVCVRVCVYECVYIDFYTRIPDLFEIVPGVLLGEDAIARHAKAVAEAEAAAAEEAAQDDATEEGEEMDEKKKAEAAAAAEKKKAEEEAAAAARRATEVAEAAAAEKRAAAAEGGAGEEEEEDPNAVERAKFDEFVAKLYTCQSRDLIDKHAQEFCYINNKLNRRKLARALFQVSQQKPEESLNVAFREL